MFSGVLVVEFRRSRTSPPVVTMRILVRNVETLHDAIVRGVAAAIELRPDTATVNRAFAIDWIRIDVDAIA
jgi:hypothetical protein